jgi:hypothetical protein
MSKVYWDTKRGKISWILKWWAVYDNWDEGGDIN